MRMECLAAVQYFHWGLVYFQVPLSLEVVRHAGKVIVIPCTLGEGSSSSELTSPQLPVPVPAPPAPCGQSLGGFLTEWRSLRMVGGQMGFNSFR